MTYISVGLRILLSIAFLGAGGAKLAGVEMMVMTFDQIGGLGRTWVNAIGAALFAKFLGKIHLKFGLSVTISRQLYAIF